MQELIKYFQSLGIQVNLHTKARGHHGFYVKNRIDVSRSTPPGRVVPTLLHEFAHYIHHKLEPGMDKTGGTFEAIFWENDTRFEQELLQVTHFVDKNSLCERLLEQRNRFKERIKSQEKIIKADFPQFQRSKTFREFERYIRGSKSKYLLKYDLVRVVSGFWNRRVEVFNISDIEKDFPDMPAAFAAYFRLRSAQRRQSRVSARINRLQKYYKKPSELFARLVEGLYIDRQRTCELAPYTTQRFFGLLDKGYYGELATVVNSCKI